MVEVPIKFCTFSPWSQQFVLVKLLEVGFYEVMGKAPIFRPFFIFFEPPIFSKKIMGGAPMMRPSVFFFPPMTLISLVK